MNHILGLKLHGIQVSRPYKLLYNQRMKLYLYPKDYFSRISEIDEFQRILNSFNSDLYNCLIPEPLGFQIGNDRFTYLVVECFIDIYQDENLLFLWELRVSLSTIIGDVRSFLLQKKKQRRS